MITKEQERVKRLRAVMDDLNGVRETLDAMASQGREGSDALRLMSVEVDRAFATLDGIAEALESENGEGVA